VAEKATYEPLPDPVVVSEALAEVAAWLRTQKRESYAVTCDYARKSLAPLIALDDNGIRFAVQR
jgi:hypothetical protein